MAPKRITVIGSLNTDLVTLTPRVPSGGETLTATSFSTGPGGKGANQAVACARLGRCSSGSIQTQFDDIIVRMVGAVGDDEFGPRLLSSLSADGIDTSGIKTVDGQTTGVAVVLVEESSGENRILLNPGANHTLQPSDFLMPESLGTPPPDLIVLQLEIPVETVLQILRTAKEAKIEVLLNPAPAVRLPQEAYIGLTHLVMNESEAAILTGRSLASIQAEPSPMHDTTQWFLKKGTENVVVTRGAQGSCYANPGRLGGEYTADKVERVVDTTAAGDTWVGAYSVQVAAPKANWDDSLIDDIMKWANSAAARAVEKKGAQSSIPWATEIGPLGKLTKKE